MPAYSLGERRVTFLGKERFVAPDATLIGAVVVGERANIWFKVVVRGDNEHISIGEGVNVQDGSVLHADPGFPLSLGKDVSVGHMALLHGCTVGEGSLIGMGSIIMNGAVIGKHCLVGAGALIPEGKTFRDGVLIVGSPAKIVRDLTPEEIARIGSVAPQYVERAQRYQREMQPQDIPG
jgi:carbonic anhydrase/acetyltransferase-like protein (isoleucine patch superfamily)